MFGARATRPQYLTSAVPKLVRYKFYNPLVAGKTERLLENRTVSVHAGAQKLNDGYKLDIDFEGEVNKKPAKIPRDVRHRKPASSIEYEKSLESGYVKVNEERELYNVTVDRRRRDHNHKDPKPTYSKRPPKDKRLNQDITRLRVAARRSIEQNERTERWIDLVNKGITKYGTEVPLYGPSKRKLEKLEEENRRITRGQLERAQKKFLEDQARAEQREIQKQLSIEGGEVPKFDFIHPESEYLYGTGPVLAALQGNKRAEKRMLFSSYSYQEVDERILDLLGEHKIPYKFDYPRYRLDVMARTRLHNKYVLETTPLFLPSIQSVKISSTPSKYITVHTFDQKISEIERKVLPKGKNKAGKYPHPLGLYIDEVSDCHNMGAIIRSAYYFGVDFVVVSTKNSAPLNATVAKTSAGALDHISIYSASGPLGFVSSLRLSGDWNIVTTMVETPEDPKARKELNEIAKLQDEVPLKIEPSKLNQLYKDKPTLLVMGSEGNGVRKNISRKATHWVTIRGGQDPENLDSLNVSVANALLLSQFFDREVFD